MLTLIQISTKTNTYDVCHQLDTSCRQCGEIPCRAPAWAVHLEGVELKALHGSLRKVDEEFRHELWNFESLS